MGNKVTIEKQVEDGICCETGEVEPRYPWGTSVNFEDELLEQLGVEGLTVGDEVTMMITAKVKSTSEYSNENENGVDSDKSMSFQFTTVQIETGKKADAADILYGEK